MARIRTALTELLGIEHPILLAPMGSAAGGRLAAAVTRAGGLGLIGSGYADGAAIKRELAAAGNTRVGIGLILWALNERPEVLDVALAASPPAVMLSFGDPVPYMGTIRDAGCKIICMVQTLAEARQAAGAGADVIIAQGRDAGGHAGTTRGTMGLVPAVVDAVHPIPVVAAGGIADGRGLAAALALGASGILMGTRFAVSRESLWSEAVKQGAVAAGGDQTQQTRVFDIVRGANWPNHYPGRAVKNAFSERWHGRETELQAAREAAERAYDGAAPNDLSTRVLWAGESVDLVGDVMSAGDIVEWVVDEAVAALERGVRLTR
ncbi:MAG TPA: nitronate monooxygenase [Acetobacteraceae bacterium]